MKILITGIAGSGKSTIIMKLAEMGYQTVDLDTSNTCVWVNKETEVEAVYKEGYGSDWIQQHRWQVVTPRLVDLMKTFSQDKDIYVSGKVARKQLDDMVKIFDVIYLLKPNDQTIDNRLATRESNIHNFAKKKEEREIITKHRDKFEQACLDAGAIPLDNHGTLDEIIKILTSSHDKNLLKKK